MLKTKLPCGCIETDTRKIALCEVHRAEWSELHGRALAEHRGVPMNAPLPVGVEMTRRQAE